MGKPPKLIFLGAADYEVKQRKMIDNNRGLLGATDNEDTTIYIKRCQSPSSKRDTLLHEVLHALIWLSGYNHSTRLSFEKEERLVRSLAPWILAALRDNPELVRYLLEE